MATLIVTAGMVLLGMAAEGVPARALMSCLAAQYLLVAVVGVARRLRIPAARLQVAETLVDLLIITACVHLTGGVGGKFALLYFFPVVFSAYQSGRRGALTTSMAGAAMFLGYTFLVAAGTVTPPTVRFVGGSVSSALLQGHLIAGLLLVVGYLAGELSARVERKARQLADQREELRHARSETQGILENMSSGVITMDRKGIIRRVNPAAERILATPAPALEGQAIQDALGDSMPILVGHLLESVAGGHTTDRAEINVERVDGSSLPLGLSISQQMDGDGDAQGVIAVFQDLSSVVKMRERMRANDRLAAMGELSASIAHEIRNPLASIRGSVEMLSGELPLDGENQRLMELVLKESARLDRILSDFLAYARLKPVHRANRHLGDLLEGLHGLLMSREDVGGTMTVEVDDLPVDLIVEVDEELMTQVFLNLAINALDAMEGQGHLRVLTAIRPDEVPAEVAIRFLDEGPGIEADAMPRLFEPFFTTKTQGTGLGLPLANRIVSNHDGRIEARNLDGGGAEFQITLPVVGIWRDGTLDRNPGALREFTVGAA